MPEPDQMVPEQLANGPIRLAHLSNEKIRNLPGPTGPSKFFGCQEGDEPRLLQEFDFSFRHCVCLVSLDSIDYQDRTDFGSSRDPF